MKAEFSQALGISEETFTELLERGIVRLMRYRNIEYAVFRKSTHGVGEGTAVVMKDGKVYVIPPYPSIQRILLLESVRKHFIDTVVIEEKLDGYNVRVAMLGNEIYAFTRGGFICPYTTHRIRHDLGRELRQLLEDNDSLIVAGEVIGPENPYVPHEYPEAGGFSFFAFDILSPEGKQLPVDERNALLDKYGVPRVRELGRVSKEELREIRGILKELDRDGREGVVMKDPLYRVPPLKYTTHAANIGDLSVGMRFFFDEGRSYIFSRLLREIFMLYEEGAGDERIREIAEKLGMSLLVPALNTVREVEAKGAVFAEYRLRVYDERVIEEILDFMQSLGMGPEIINVKREGDSIIFVLKKMKRTSDEVRHILKTGYAPID